MSAPRPNSKLKRYTAMERDIRLALEVLDRATYGCKSSDFDVPGPLSPSFAIGYAKSLLRHAVADAEGRS